MGLRWFVASILQSVEDILDTLIESGAEESEFTDEEANGADQTLHNEQAMDSQDEARLIHQRFVF